MANGYTDDPGREGMKSDSDHPHYDEISQRGVSPRMDNIRAQFDKVDYELERFSQLASRLEDVIGPVMGPASGEKRGEDDADSKQRSDVYHTIGGQHTRLRRYNDILAELIDRVEL